eukprot:CAMPEP_0114320754 /NCGR_PEP_ID=MMETSP0059-20121206/26141_1 /TAXON_ID=36894 /ORGANISM="Pyramimonas parkeae, Strain CCMP726" /LENGTH=30 /DNA_ID= /DNA_START= /DNA_END= /DNA_ORIENTATION=
MRGSWSSVGVASSGIDDSEVSMPLRRSRKL